MKKAFAAIQCHRVLESAAECSANVKRMETFESTVECVQHGSDANGKVADISLKDDLSGPVNEEVTPWEQNRYQYTVALAIS